MRNSMPWSRTSQHQFNIKHSSIGHPKAMVLITSSLIWTHSLKSNFSMFSRLLFANKDMKSSAMTFLALFSFKILEINKTYQFHVNKVWMVYTVWKSCNFYAALILCEINFGDVTMSKLPLRHFLRLSIVTFWKFHTWKRQKFPKIRNSERLKYLKCNGICRDFKTTKIDFT